MSDNPNWGMEETTEHQSDSIRFVGSSYFNPSERRAQCLAEGIDHDDACRLIEALGDPDRLSVDQRLSDMLASGITREVIADVYVPFVARAMGDAWCEDEMSFAEVTIGVARLQGLLRKLGPEWRADYCARAHAPSVLIITQRDEFHTLGAMILSGKLRRLGVSTQLCVGIRPNEVGDRIRKVGFDMVMVSAAKGEGLDSIRRLVDAAKRSVDPAPFVVLGGSVLDTDLDIRRITGADAATCDPSEALELCGLKIPPRLVAQNTTET